MFELIDIQPDINVLESEYKRLLGFPPHYVLQGRVQELAEWARRWYAENGKPWIYGRQTPLQLVPDRPNNCNGLTGEIHVMQSGMRQPKKSLLALIGITQHVERVKRSRNLIPCENCSFSPCQYRRVPYKNSLPAIEDVRRLQPPAPE